MKKYPVLVTAVGGNIGQGIIKALRASKLSFEITGVDMEPLSAGFSLCDNYAVLPRTGSASYPKAFERVLSKHNIQAIFASSPAELNFFVKAKNELEKKFGLKVLINSAFAIETGKDKYETYKFLKAHGFKYPKTILPGSRESVPYPAILKPRFGFTSHHVYRIENHKALSGYKAFLDSSVLQEFLPGDEYTAATLSGPDAKVLTQIILKRHLNQGTTYRTELYQNAKVEKELRRIAECLGSVGSCNFQFKLIRNRPVIFEINPRFSGTAGVRYLYGWNDAELCFRLFVLGENIRPPRLKQAVILRYWNEIVLERSNFEQLMTSERAHRGFENHYGRKKQ